MTKEYLKMADVFPGDVESCQISGWKHQVKYVPLKTIQQYAAHAINSHDELVEQNENMKLRINQLLSERNATGVAIEKALNGILPEQHLMINRLQMIAGVAAKRDELVAEVERLREFERDAMRYRFLCDNCTTQQADSCGPIFVMTIRQKDNPFNVGLSIDEAMKTSR